MSIDWITVAAQIANFLVLVWLLKRFLYRPILDGIDAREAEITHRMAEAQAAKAAAASVQADYHDKVRALHAATAQMSQTIRTSAEAQRDALLADAQQQMARDQASLQAHLAQEGRTYTARLHRAGADALLSLLRKALADLADDTLEARMAQHLVRQLGPMAADLKTAAGDAVLAVVTTQHALPQAVQADMTAQVTALFPLAQVRFATDASQPAGLVLRMGGAQLAWTVESYVDGLDALMDATLAADTGTGVDTGTGAQPHAQ